MAADAYGTTIKNCIIAFNREGINGPSVNPPTVLSYNDVVSNNTAGNYNIPVSPGVGTITNDPRFVTLNPSSPDFVKLSSSSPCIDKGDPADWDDWTQNGRIDMGAREYIPSVGTPDMLIVKSITNITLGGNPVNPIPGSTISYKIKYTNRGSAAANNVIIYDKIITNVVYKTQNNITSWTAEFSTNANPNQAWNSSDYTKTIPSQKDKIRWIRWRKPSISAGESGALYFSVIIK